MTPAVAGPRPLQLAETDVRSWRWPLVATAWARPGSDKGLRPQPVLLDSKQSTNHNNAVTALAACKNGVWGAPQKCTNTGAEEIAGSWDGHALLLRAADPRTGARADIPQQ